MKSLVDDVLVTCDEVGDTSEIAPMESVNKKKN